MVYFVGLLRPSRWCYININRIFFTIWAYILITGIKSRKKFFFEKKFHIPPHTNLLARPNSYGGVHEIFFEKKNLSWFYSSNQNVRSNRKKKSCLFWRSTNGLVVISPRNRPLKPFASGLFRRLIMTKPLVLHQNKGDFF